MSVVAIWHEVSDDVLLAVADTRIPSPLESGGTQVCTEVGSKLFMLPMICRRIASGTDLFRSPHFRRTFGFAFAGDVLPALMTHSHANAVLQNLVSVTTSDPPTLKDVADMVRKVAERISGEMLRNDNNYGRFEYSVFGECPHSNKFEIYVIKVPPSSGSEATFEPIDLYQAGLPTTLGDSESKSAFNTAFKRIQNNGDPHGRTLRASKLTVESIVSEGLGRVGDSLSIGMVPHADDVSQRNFQLLRWLQPIEKGKPNAIVRFSGIDVDSEIGQVGPCSIGMMRIV